MPDYLTVPEAAALLNLQTQNIKYQCENGKLACERRGCHFFISKDSLKAYADAHAAKAKATAKFAAAAARKDCWHDG